MGCKLDDMLVICRRNVITSCFRVQKLQVQVQVLTLLDQEQMQILLPQAQVLKMIYSSRT
jgi:hypothetical protein